MIAEKRRAGHAAAIAAGKAAQIAVKPRPARRPSAIFRSIHCPIFNDEIKNVISACPRESRLEID